MSRVALARAGAAGAAVLVALASGIRDLPDTGGWLIDQRRQFESWGPRERDAVAAESQGLPFDAFEFFRARATPRLRYFIDAAPSDLQPDFDRAQAARMFSRYYLLPAIQVPRPEDADVVFTIDRDPRTLGIALRNVEQDSRGSYYAAERR